MEGAGRGDCDKLQASLTHDIGRFFLAQAFGEGWSVVLFGLFLSA